MPAESKTNGDHQSNVWDRLIYISGKEIEDFWKTQLMTWKQTVRTKELYDCFELKKGSPIEVTKDCRFLQYCE
jgi:hypothetical protein